MARPTKLDDTTMQNMERAIILSANKKLTAAAMGVTYETLRAWLERGEAEMARMEQSGDELPSSAESIYYECFTRFNAARAKSALNLLSKVHVAADQDWRAAMKLLQSMFPGEFGAKKPIELSMDEQTTRRIVKVVKGIDIDRI